MPGLQFLLFLLFQLLLFLGDKITTHLLPPRLGLYVTGKTFLNEAVLSIPYCSNKYLLASPNYF